MITFYIHYECNPSEFLQIQFMDASENVVVVKSMVSFDQNYWHSILDDLDGRITHYRYVHMDKQGQPSEEDGEMRPLVLEDKTKYQLIHDQWQSKLRPDSIFRSSAFRDIIFYRNSEVKQSKIGTSNILSMRLHAPNIPHEFALAIVGNTLQLGNWTEPQIMICDSFPIWKVDLPLEGSSIEIEYKYVLCNPASKQIMQWEAGENRKLSIHLPDDSLCWFQQNDQFFEFGTQPYRGSGVAIPVFALRSSSSFGIGEFTDLISMIDFAEACKMHFVQTLPVNDTIARKTWEDSYPYAAISVFALHPLYIHVPAVGSFDDPKVQKAYEKDQKILESKTELDFDLVLEKKFYYLKYLFDKQKSLLGSDPNFNPFLEENSSWIYAYAAFCALRDRYETADFNQWPEHSAYVPQKISQLMKEDEVVADTARFYQFLQYHADKQLVAARAYGKSKQVVLKGDLPIGIYRYSCDAWVAPELYNMNEQAGAPPDAYAVLGQNWGFPTYNWSEMARDNFSWWRSRMEKLATYFDALRIDHILGFFRIWMIPLHQVQGTLGLFNPRKAYTRDELMHYGLYGDLSRYTQPYLGQAMLEEIFGSSWRLVAETFLEEHHAGVYNFMAEFPDQIAIERYIDAIDDTLLKKFTTQILSLMSEVLLIEEPRSMGTAYNPRITLQTTFLYKSLDPHVKDAFDRMYIDYFYHRHDAFWKAQAIWKLPALLNASNMFICGEDLGMIPASVPEVMERLNIVPLEIQRMPKGNEAFGVPHEYPYYSVASPSCHDMSTIRGWWEENGETRQRFYHEHMGLPEKAPSTCSVETVKTILQEHLESTSMLTIFPIQDILGMDSRLRRQNAAEEQINIPSDPKHYWRYRLHLNVDDLVDEKELILAWRTMIIQSGRS